MPKSSWIQGAELVPENKPYKVDAAGRVVIPVAVRDELHLKQGSKVNIKAVVINGKKYILIEKEGD